MPDEEPTVKVTLHTGTYTPHTETTGGEYPHRPDIKWGGSQGVFSVEWLNNVIWPIDLDTDYTPRETTRMERARTKVRSWWYRNRLRVHRGPCYCDDYCNC